MAMDLELHVLSDNSLDIDVINGWPTLMNTTNTPRQRAAVAAYIAKGSVPGQTEIGAEWASYMTGQRSLVELDNQVKQNIQDMVGTETIMDQIMPLYVPSDGGVAIRLWTMNQQENSLA